MARFDPRPASLALLEAFRDGEPISALPEGGVPATAAQGERIARAVIEGLALPVVGFRALADGATGPLLAPRLMASGTAVPRAALPGLAPSAACIFPLARALPASAEPYTPRRVLAALGPARAAIDLACWRTKAPPATMPARLADLAGLGLVVLADRPRGAARADPRRLRLGWEAGAPLTVDAVPQLMAAAEAARRAGGLPAGAALAVAGLAPAPDCCPADLVLRVTGAGKATARLV